MKISVSKMLTNYTNFESLVAVGIEWIRAATMPVSRVVFHNLGFKLVNLGQNSLGASPCSQPVSLGNPSMLSELQGSVGGWWGTLSSDWNTVGAQHVEMLP